MVVAMAAATVLINENNDNSSNKDEWKMLDRLEW